MPERRMVRMTAEAPMLSNLITQLEKAEAPFPPLPPEVIAAAWKAWKSRHGGKLGPGPAFTEAIEAAVRCLAVLRAKEARDHG